MMQNVPEVRSSRPSLFWKSLLWTAVAAGGILGGIALVSFDPAASLVFPPCPFHYLTGFHCPGCGSLRATHQLLHGNIGAALALNPLMVISLPFLAYHSIAIAIYRFTRRVLPGLILSGRTLHGILVIIFLYWILRNVPYYPFTLLAPH